MDPNYRQFDEKGVTAAINEEGSTTAQGTDELTMQHPQRLGPTGLSYLTELFYFSVARVDIPAIWKNSS